MMISNFKIHSSFYITNRQSTDCQWLIFNKMTSKRRSFSQHRRGQERVDGFGDDEEARYGAVTGSGRYGAVIGGGGGGGGGGVGGGGKQQPVFLIIVIIGRQSDRPFCRRTHCYL